MSEPASSSVHDQAHGAHEAHGAHDERHYVKIWAILLVLLVVSVLGPFIGVPVVTLMTAFGIAVVKAYLVAKHFMHLNIQPKYIVYLLVAGLTFIGLFFAGVAPDVMAHDGQRWENLAAKAETARVLAAREAAAASEPPPFVAAEVFAATCGPCHGTEGRGDGPTAAALTPHPANFHDPAFWQTRDRDQLVRVITGGGASVGRSALMPAFGSSYNAEQIGQLADHVMTFRP